MGNCASGSKEVKRGSASSEDAIVELTKQIKPDVDGKVRYSCYVHGMSLVLHVTTVSGYCGMWEAQHLLQGFANAEAVEASYWRSLQV